MTLPAIASIRYPTRILCPTDFTPCSRRALEYAIALARPVGAEVTLLHVLLLPLSSLDTDEPDWMPAGPVERTEILERLRRFAEPLEAAGLPTRLLLREGSPADEILAAAASLQPDLVVMGSHGRRGLGNLLGSQAARVLKLAPCPVLTVSGVDGAPAEAPVRIQEVLCAASGSERSPRTVEYARCLAAGMQAHLTLLYVAERGLAAGDSAPPWDPALQSATPSVDRCVASGSPRAEILDLAMKRGADLIVIGNHDRGLEAIGCLGSTSDSVVRQASCGVVTVKAASWPPTPGRASSKGALALTGAGR
jgi:nucleotide-binding universal stress UspA family protein